MLLHFNLSGILSVIRNPETAAPAEVDAAAEVCTATTEGCELWWPMLLQRRILSH